MALGIEVINCKFCGQEVNRKRTKFAHNSSYKKKIICIPMNRKFCSKPCAKKYQAIYKEAYLLGRYYSYKKMKEALDKIMLDFHHEFHRTIVTETDARLFLEKLIKERIKKW